VLPESMSANSEFRERFNREADIAARLFHPHIVGVHDRGEFEGHLWISMDYVEGTDAGQQMKGRYPAGMPARDVSAIVTAVADALDYAHKRGLLHRDVKPANILLTEPEDGKRRILLADFGIARPLGDISGLTATNFTVRTLAYAAPEQLMGEEVDSRADQYALAATAYQLLTGSQLFPHSNPAVVISQHLNAYPPAVSQHRPGLADLDAVVAKALSKAPADRYIRCTDFARALADHAGALPQSSPSAPTAEAKVRGKAATKSRSSTPTSPPSKQQARSRRRWLIPAAAGAIVVISESIYGTQPRGNPRASAILSTSSFSVERPSASRRRPATPDGNGPPATVVGPVA
jgi:serine/threonine protein kinase, bacterial